MDITKGRITHDKELGVREEKHTTKREEGLVIAYSIETGGVQKTYIFQFAQISFKVFHIKHTSNVDVSCA